MDWQLENEKLLEAVEVDFQNTIDEFASIERDEVEVLEAKLTLDQLSKSSVNSEKYIWFFEEVQKILKSV